MEKEVWSLKVDIYNDISSEPYTFMMCNICRKGSRMGFTINQKDNHTYPYVPKDTPMPYTATDIKYLRMGDFICSKCFSHFLSKETFQTSNPSIPHHELAVTFLTYKRWEKQT